MRIPCKALPLSLALASCATPQAGISLDAFEATLAERDSATLSLEKWCGTRGFANPATVTATRVRDNGRTPPPELQAMLATGTDEPLGYRHVRLACGGRVLSEAYNWYVPARLPEAMNRTLETGDTPFGKVVGPLGFKRESVASTKGVAAGCPRGTILSNRAVLRLPDGTAISAVVECYTPENLR